MISRIDRVGEAEALPGAPEEPLPLPVAPDWEEWLRRSTHLARLIDRHLDHEERRRLLARERLTPMALCLEQRVSMVTDLLATLRCRIRRAH